MSLSQDPGTARRIDGTCETTKLALEIIDVLQEADLEDVIDELQTRVFARSKEELFEITQMGGNRWHSRFKPMVEFLLCEVQHIADNTAFSLEERRRHIQWALDGTGF